MSTEPEQPAGVQVRAVQSWMALDLWQAIYGNDTLEGFEAAIDHSGWAEVWAAMLAEVRAAT